MGIAESGGIPGLPGISLRFMRTMAKALMQTTSAQPGPAASLAFDDLVALLQQPLALAILALLLLLDVGTFLAGHDK
jgi:hypothetical protein